MKLFSIMFLIFSFEACFAKDLYLTVNKDYSPEENPELLVHYTKSIPMEFRILKPKNMKKFISGQIDLRRSWRSPEVVHNTSRYLAKGLNKSKMGLDWIRMVVDNKLRKSVIDQYGGGKPKKLGTPLIVGPKKLISYPKNFEVVDTISFFPSSDHNGTDFDVPGYNYWFSNHSNERSKNVVLPKLKPGFYLVQVVQGALEGQVVLVVNNAMARLQQSDNNSLVHVVDRKGAPLEDAEVIVRNLRGEWFKSGKSNKEGVFEFDAEGENELIVAVNSETHGTAIIDSEYFSTQAIYPDLYLYTDRPMYKSHNEVNFKGVLRKKEQGLSKLLFGPKKAKVSLVNSSNGMVTKEIVLDISDYGSFSGKFDLSKTDISDNGLYRVKAEVIDDTFIGEFRIKDYIKPILYSKLEALQETVRAGSTINTTLEVGRYAGGTPNNARYKAELFRVRVQAPEWLDDAGLNEDGSPITYYWDVKKQQDVSLPLPIGSYDEGKVIDGKAHISISVPYDLPGDPNYDYKIMLKVSTTDDDNNLTTASKTFLELEAENMLQLRMSHVYVPEDEKAWLKVRSIYPSGKSYGATKGTVEFEYEAYGTVGVERPATVFETNESGVFKIDVPTDAVGKIIAHVEIVDKKGVKTSSSVSVLVAGRESEPIVEVSALSLISRRDYFFPEEESKVLALLPEGWGVAGKNQGKIYVTIAGTGLFEHRVQDVNGLNAWIVQKIEKRYGTGVYIIVAYPHSKKGWVEKRLNFRIPQKDKALSVEIMPKLSNTLPGSEQVLDILVKDQKGNPVEAEVSVSVVDKAVLDLQPEIRPNLIDFFYPRERLNLMSFLSTSFQGYGYGEYITSLYESNHYVAMTKQEGKILKEKDTAYWNAHLVTDSNGKGNARFRLPGNQTIWNVSAVVLDKDGRFGEGTSEFTSQMPLQIELAYPNFIREGDSFDFGMKYSNTKEEDGITYSSRAEFGSSLKVKGKMETGGSLAKGESSKEEYNVVYEKSNNEKFVSFKNTLSIKDKGSMSFSYDILNKKSFIESHSTISFGEKAEIEHDFSKESILSENMSLSLLGGLGGALVASMNYMISYPHGCVEQLMSKTVPNLVIAEMFNTFQEEDLKAIEEEKIIPTDFWGVLKRNFKDLQKLVRSFGKQKYEKIDEKLISKVVKAKEFAKEGISKLASYQHYDGSMAWFGGGSSDIRMTIYVLMGLGSTNNREVMERINFKDSINWLRRKVRDRTSSAGIALTYLESTLVKVGRDYLDESNVMPTLKLQMKYILSKGTLLEKSLFLLALENYGISGDLAQEKSMLVQLVRKRLRQGLEMDSGVSLAAFYPTRNQQFDFPGREVSVMSIAGRSLYEADGMTDSLKNKLVGWLLDKFNGRNFGSTIDTSTTLIHSAWLFKEELESKSELPTPYVEIDGKRVPKEKLDITNSISGVYVKFPSRLIPEKKVKVLVHSGMSFRNIKMSYKVKRSFDYQKAESNGWSVHRLYFKLNEKTMKKSFFDPKSMSLKVGDLILTEVLFKKSKLENKAKRRSDYLYMSSDIPAGMTVIQEDKELISKFRIDGSSLSFTKRVVNPDHIKWYIEEKYNRSKNSEYKVNYFSRVNYRGKFTSGVSKVEDFYDEEINGISYSDRFRVTK